MDKKIPSKFKVRIVAQGDMIQDVIADASEFFDRREVYIGRKEVQTPVSCYRGNAFDRFLNKIFRTTTTSYEDVYETQVTRGYDIWFHFGGKPQNFKFEKSEVEKLIENGEWIIID